MFRRFGKLDAAFVGLYGRRCRLLGESSYKSRMKADACTFVYIIVVLHNRHIRHIHTYMHTCVLVYTNRDVAFSYCPNLPSRALPYLTLPTLLPSPPTPRYPNLLPFPAFLATYLPRLPAHLPAYLLTCLPTCRPTFLPTCLATNRPAHQLTPTDLPTDKHLT